METCTADVAAAALQALAGYLDHPPYPPLCKAHFDLQDAARDLADDGDGQGSEEEHSSSSTWLRRASASSRDGGGGGSGGASSPADGTPEEVARLRGGQGAQGPALCRHRCLQQVGRVCLFTSISQVCHICL